MTFKFTLVINLPYQQTQFGYQQNPVVYQQKHLIQSNRHKWGGDFSLKPLTAPWKIRLWPLQVPKPHRWWLDGSHVWKNTWTIGIRTGKFQRTTAIRTAQRNAAPDAQVLGTHHGYGDLTHLMVFARERHSGNLLPHTHVYIYGNFIHSNVM